MPPQGEIEYPVHSTVIRSKGPIIAESDYPKSELIVSNFFSTVPSAHQANLNGKGIHIRFSLCYEPIFLSDQNISFPSYNLTPHLLVLSNHQKKLIHLLHGIQGSIVPMHVNSNFRNLNIRRNNKKLTIAAIMRLPEGGFSWQRDQDYLIQHLKYIKKKYPHITINLICPPNEFNSSLKLKKLKKENIFSFYTPAIDEALCTHYSEADIFVSSSIIDTGGLPGLEAMKCGAALVTVYSGGNADYCKHEENCILSYRYENRLSADIERLIKDSILRKKLSINGEKEANQWNLNKSVSAFEAICLNILNSK
jgi:glycosyltransferase involved in cell wall biosynthesis